MEAMPKHRPSLLQPTRCRAGADGERLDLDLAMLVAGLVSETEIRRLVRAAVGRPDDVVDARPVRMLAAELSIHRLPA